MPMEKLFVYGTLKDPVVQKTVFGRIVEGIPDSLDGYRKTEIAMSDGVFPIIIRESGSAVDGLILEVTREELALIDRYETDAYRRVRVTLKSGQEAWVYCE